MPPYSPERRSLDRRAADLRACREILSRGSKSFAFASLLLPHRVREPAAALYAFCRVADDAVDGVSAASGRVALADLRRRLDRIADGRPIDHPVDRALADVVREHELPRQPLDALLEGFAWDLEGRSYRTIDELFRYGARVAGSVGVLMTTLMGRREPSTLARACDLGVAMQLTNIARDVGEDARNGRVYLPEAWLDAAGLHGRSLVARPAHSPALGSVVARLVAEADVLYERSDGGVAALPRDCRPAIRAARLIYSDLHRSIARRGFDTVTTRSVVSKPRKVMLAMRALLLPFRFHRHAPAAELPPLHEARFLLPAPQEAE